MVPAFDLIIFDCDGVLVDSEPLAMRVLLSTLAREGIVLDEATAFRDFLGRSLATISASLASSHGKQLGEDALERMRGDLYDLYRRELSANPGVGEMLSTVGVAVCVASSSHLERIRISLEITGLLSFFGDHIFSSSMVDRGKPAPDLFFHAARTMGVPPERCLVIEDSPAGIEAARAAGMTVFAYVGGSHVAPSGIRPAIDALRPDAVVTRMSDLPSLIARWDSLVVGVDVGTLSARAAVFTRTGIALARADKPIDLRRIGASGAEHDSEQIWSAVCGAVRAAVTAAGVDPARIAGLAFDATCSLILRDAAGHPLPASSGSEDRWDTISWFDHRAMEEARDCTATGHRVLEFAGGVMSPEMEVPKLMWLKRRRLEIWSRLGHAFDLADFLSWRATGSTARSQSTLTSKWNFLAHEPDGWDRSFLDAVGLGDLVERCALPNTATPVGATIGPLTADAAAALGLPPSCIVAAGLVDAHAGALGLLGPRAADPSGLHRHLTLIAGTSNSILALADRPRPIGGIWGPYFGAILPGVWLSEGGQSAAGALLDHIIRWHAGRDADGPAHGRIVARIRELQDEGDALAPGLHVLPDFHGNRSPLAEPEARGMIVGLTLDSSFDGLCRLYYRCSVALGLGLRQIVETYAGAGYEGGTLLVTGGHVQNGVLMDSYAETTGATLLWSADDDSVLLGAGIAAAAGCAIFPSIVEAACTMRGSGELKTLSPSATPRHDHDYRVMLALQRDRSAYAAEPP